MSSEGGAVAAPTVGRLIDESLFADVDGSLFLSGSRCEVCTTVTFPAQGSCPRCTTQCVRPHRLATAGSLWAFTVQRFPPKSPYLGAQSPFTPYGVGYVDLAGEVLVEARLVCSSFDELSVGLPMELVLDEVVADGPEAIWTFAFAASGAEMNGATA